MRKFYLILVFALVVGLIAACGGSGGSSSGGSSDGAGNVAAGEKLFAEKLVGVQPGCITCHSLEEGVVMVGPSMAGIGSRAGSSVAGQSAEEYLLASINAPDEHVTDGFEAGQMPAALADELTDQQKQDLVAYLMSLK
jgi:mono/diheme cytochrome c family protein